MEGRTEGFEAGRELALAFSERLDGCGLGRTMPAIALPDDADAAGTEEHSEDESREHSED
jgi:hypothetical protein